MSAKTWLTIEVCYIYNNKDCRRLLRNCDWKLVKAFRETVFQEGFMYQDEDTAGHWIIVHPHCITSVDVWKQDIFFKN